jgi:hypothetical protein
MDRMRDGYHFEFPKDTFLQRIGVNESKSLYLCNECCKTFRSNESKCAICGKTKCVEQVTKINEAGEGNDDEFTQEELTIIDRKVDRGMSLLADNNDSVDKVMDIMTSEEHRSSLDQKGWEEVERQLQDYVDSLEDNNESKKIKEGTGEELYQKILNVVKDEIKSQLEKTSKYDEMLIRDKIANSFNITKEEAENIIINAASEKHLDLGDQPVFESKCYCERCGWQGSDPEYLEDKKKKSKRVKEAVEIDDKEYNSAIMFVQSVFEDMYDKTSDVFVSIKSNKVVKRNHIDLLSQDVVEWLKDNKPELVKDFTALESSILTEDLLKGAGYKIVDTSEVKESRVNEGAKPLKKYNVKYRNNDSNEIFNFQVNAEDNKKARNTAWSMLKYDYASDLN